MAARTWTVDPRIRPGQYAEEHLGFETPCWVWQMATKSDGYGVISVGNHRTRLAHCVYYEIYVGLVPEGKELHHRCEQPSCVNPDHLEPLTRAEHAQTYASAQKTHCVNGHEYTPENTYWRKDGRGKRGCKTCRRQQMLDYYARKRAA